MNKIVEMGGTWGKRLTGLAAALSDAIPVCRAKELHANKDLLVRRISINLPLSESTAELLQVSLLFNGV